MIHLLDMVIRMLDGSHLQVLLRDKEDESWNLY